MENLIPKAVGPYSAYRVIGNTIYISGQLGLEPNTNMLEKTVEEQAKQSLNNLKNILELNGFNMSNVIKTTVLLSDISDFSKVNEIYASFFSEPYPARSAFAVKDLPKNALVEIEAIAIKE
ncbi:Rid family detoxifying hydrolase [Caviibacter abscessus]|uniref:Rid family detoxifying hydrolase n=1 Tax=Caviibacter abscessus TaxID=1766719 RepID=UPI00082BA17E|nr:Rid family detoxifying hydrolase [Caviibacter abscessus]